MPCAVDMAHKRKRQGENRAKRDNVQRIKMALFVITVVATVAVNFICRRRSYNSFTPVHVTCLIDVIPGGRRILRGTLVMNSWHAQCRQLMKVTTSSLSVFRRSTRIDYEIR